MGLTSRSTLGKIAGCWLPIFTFFALGYEHSVVNMFLIPAGIWMGAPVSYREWWLWNQLPVTLGNLIGGMLFVGLPVLSIGNAGREKTAEPLRIHSAEPDLDAVEA